MKIYNKINLIKPNFFQKLLNISPKGNFVLELQNLLAENEENISAIKIDDIEQLKNKYKVKKTDFRTSRESLFEKYRSFCFHEENFTEINKSQLIFLCNLLDLDLTSLKSKISEKEKLFFTERVRKIFSQFDLSDSNLKEIEELKKSLNISDTTEQEIFQKEGSQIFKDKLLALSINTDKTFDIIRKELDFLQRVLKVSEQTKNKIYSEVKEKIYVSKVKKAISDNVLTDAENDELEMYEKELGLSESEALSIYSRECKEKIQSYTNQIVSRRRMSPDDEKILNDMSKGLQVNLEFDLNFHKFRKFWEIESGTLQPISSPINLQKSENLYYSARIEWYEERTKTTYVTYGGITANFRIAKGLSLRSGMIAPNRHTEEYMKLIDTGEVYFTNKRIIFVGEHGNKTIPFSKILDITPYGDGIEVGKDTGRKPFFKFNDVETMGLYLARLLKDS